jgi:hypothetical protein
MSCIDASVRIVTKSPKVGPLLIFCISLEPSHVTRSNMFPVGGPGESTETLLLIEDSLLDGDTRTRSGFSTS